MSLTPKSALAIRHLRCLAPNVSVAILLICLGQSAISMATHPLDPETIATIARSDVVSIEISPSSTMPTGLLTTLSQKEIFDLLAYLESGADPDHEAFED